MCSSTAPKTDVEAPPDTSRPVSSRPDSEAPLLADKDKDQDKEKNKAEEANVAAGKEVELKLNVVDATAQPSLLENPKVLLGLSTVDFVAASMLAYGCAQFLPVNIVDPHKAVLGLNLLCTGLFLYCGLVGVFCRETLRALGWKSMEFAELVCTIVALVCFLLGCVLFYPAKVLPSWVHTLRIPLMRFSNWSAPEYLTHLPGSLEKDPGPQGWPLTAGVFFFVGSMLFCVGPMINMINMSNENLKDRRKQVACVLVKGVAGLFFLAGTMYFIPGIGCNGGAAALGGYQFVGASICFMITAVSDMVDAASMLRS
eukprot:TRINITY_DN14393_c0_g8_i2.p1 TRINITY_DN14393_c0_g8~~TRINITY_DN14393_c0_g8_i2.p1  ORF type:complete len:334 (-),score=59.12 TRINITY_DN14393_c0_g8_i2:324-1262(-)